MIDKKIEKWVNVKGFEGLYMVSNFGNISSGYQNKILKPHKTTNGYYFINLYKNKVQNPKTVHSVVAESFLNHIPNGQTIVVDHIDNDKTNNNLDNLQLITQRENSLKDKCLPKSGYHGVSWSVSNNKWVVRPRVNGKKFLVGYFNCPMYAGRVYKHFTDFIDRREFDFRDLKDFKKQYKNLTK